jgi:hypothetical protein
MDGTVFRLQNAQSFQMTDSVQIKMRQRATILLKVCELAESYRPETDKAMTCQDELRVDEIYRLLNRAVDLPPAASWLVQVGRQLADGHPVDARRTLVALHLRQRFFRLSCSITACIGAPATAGRSRQAFAVRASVAWTAALRASPSAPVPKFSSI